MSCCRCLVGRGGVGLDDQGFVMTTQKSPRIMDGVAKRLIRVNEIDWPTLLRIMDRAVRAGEEPLPAALRFCGQLFSKQKIRIGIEEDAGEASGSGGESPFKLGPHREEVLNFSGRWELPGEVFEGAAGAGGVFGVSEGSLASGSAICGAGGWAGAGWFV